MTSPGGFFHPSWPLLHQDNHLLVLYKPAGLLVQGDETGDPCLLDLGKRWIRDNFQKPGRVYLGLVHRIDRPVAGVVLFCRTSKAAARLSDQFRRGTVRKRYLAVVEGRVALKSGRLVHHLERRDDRSSRVVACPTETSREARLSFEVLDAGSSRSLLLVHLETGRRHQIRLQLAHCGHPILGDLRYGASYPLEQKQIALLAWELSVGHPTGGHSITFQSPLPLGWPWDVPHTTAPRPPWNWPQMAELLPSSVLG